MTDIRGVTLEKIALADVAQLVEQLIRNQQVGGSNPPVGSSIQGARPAGQPLLFVSMQRSSSASAPAIFNQRDCVVFM